MLAKLVVIPLTYSCDRSNSQIIVRFLIEEMLTGMIYPESAGKGQHPEEESVHIHTKSEMMAERVNSTIALCLIINYETTSIVFHTRNKLFLDIRATEEYEHQEMEV